MSCRGEKVSVTEKDRRRRKEQGGKKPNQKKGMGCLYYPDMRLCHPFDKNRAFFLIADEKEGKPFPERGNRYGC